MWGRIEANRMRIVASGNRSVLLFRLQVDAALACLAPTDFRVR